MKKSLRILIIVFAVVVAAVVFFAAPNLNPLYSDGLSFWAFVITVGVAAILVYRGVFTIASSARGGSTVSMGKFHPAFLVVAAAPWAILVVVGIFGLPAFHSSRYRDQMPQPETRTFAKDVQPIDVNQLPIVDSDLAYNLADKKLGEKPDLGSQVTLGTPTIEKVDGKLVWAVPLEHSGFFKWLANMSGTPGYIVVSATDPRDVTYVDKYKIKYQPDAYLLDNLERHARLSGGLFTGLTDYSFELDDSGRPYWVITTYKNLVGFSLPEATGALVVDAQTGKAERYTIADMPSWVDRVQPEDFIMNQIDNRGQYIHGIFNFSNKDKFETTPGDVIVYDNGRCYLFAGLTSVGADQSSTGFMLVDMVTKKPYIYSMGGATQSAAQGSAEGKVQNLKYTASYPLITNVEGQPTYFMTLKDDAGLIKQYAFVSVEDYTTVGTGESVQDALDNFESAERGTSDGNVIESSAKKSAAGTVERFAAEAQNGSTVYEFTLKGDPTRIFTSTYDVSDQLAITKEGDSVKITYIPEEGGVNTVASFVNTSISQK